LNILTDRTNALIDSWWRRDFRLLQSLSESGKVGKIEVKVVLHEGHILFIPNKEGAISRLFSDIAPFVSVLGAPVAIAAIAGYAIADGLKKVDPNVRLV
jgi:hypothetical protein